ncbi:hypothetical protein PENTCL1PPCAC_21130, partial [Pristionchus entomophagus]
MWSSAVCKDVAEVERYKGSAVVTEEFRGADGKRYFRHFPLDGLHVLPYTKVPKEKQKGAKPRPVLPQQRYVAMKNARKDIHIVEQNETMERFGMSVDIEPIRVDQRRLDAPKMMGKTGGRLYEMKTDPLKAYAAAHVACCKTKGMEIVYADGNEVTSFDHLESTMKAFAEHRKEKREKDGSEEFGVFLILLGEKNLLWHDTLKLLEQRYALQTQHVFTDTIKKILSKPEKDRSRDYTLFNIVMKTNIKAGGENVQIEEISSLFPSAGEGSPVTLIVGLDVAHPPPLSRNQLMRGIAPDPSCIGVSSNCCTKNLQTFTGYEVYTE